jgi:hypothetical protein
MQYKYARQTRNIQNRPADCLSTPWNFFRAAYWFEQALLIAVHENKGMPAALFMCWWYLLSALMLVPFENNWLSLEKSSIRMELVTALLHDF